MFRKRRRRRKRELCVFYDRFIKLFWFQGPKKKLSKKEKARLAAELAEKAKLNAEEEAAKAAELERIRLEEERRAAIAKEKRETFEQQIRMEQLEGGLEYFNQLVSYNKKLRADAKIQEDWEFYVDCGRLPNPGKCDQMNTFLHLWENMIDHTTMEEAAKRTSDMLEVSYHFVVSSPFYVPFPAFKRIR